MKTYIAVLISLAIAAIVLLCSGVMRHDVPETEYRKLAAQPQFDCVGKLFMDSICFGSVVLVGEKVVITSVSNIMINEQPLQSSKNESRAGNDPLENARIYKPHHLFVSLKGRKYAVDKVYVHPGEFEKIDLAMLHLTEAVNVVPARLNFTDDELNSEVVGVGFGSSGVANDATNVTFIEQKIAGENVVDSLGGFEYQGLATELISDFDDPGASFNICGNSSPQRLEYMPLGHDAGGGLFRRSANGWELVGICRQSRIRRDKISESGFYGQLMYWTRVSVFSRWIRENIRY